MAEPKKLPIFIQDAADSDNGSSLLAFFVHQGIDASKIRELANNNKKVGILAVEGRRADFRFPKLDIYPSVILAEGQTRIIGGSRKILDVSALNGESNDHETLTNEKDKQESDVDSELASWEGLLRIYSSLMLDLGLNPHQKKDWDAMMKIFPAFLMGFPATHQLSHHTHTRDFLFNRGDLEISSKDEREKEKKFGHCLSFAKYVELVQQLDGQVGGVKSEPDVKTKFGQSINTYNVDADLGNFVARRIRYRTIIQNSIEKWKKILLINGKKNKNAIENYFATPTKSLIRKITDVFLLAPVSGFERWTQLLKSNQSLNCWTMGFAWNILAERVNIFSNQFNVGQDVNSMKNFLALPQIKRHYIVPSEVIKGNSVTGAAQEHIWKIAKEGSALSISKTYELYSRAKAPDPTKTKGEAIFDPVVIYAYFHREELDWNDGAKIALYCTQKKEKIFVLRPAEDQEPARSGMYAAEEKNIAACQIQEMGEYPAIVAKSWKYESILVKHVETQNVLNNWVKELKELNLSPEQHQKITIVSDQWQKVSTTEKEEILKLFPYIGWLRFVYLYTKETKNITSSLDSFISFLESSDVCAFCKQENQNEYVCGACEQVYYCSAPCVTNHWITGHAHECGKC